MINESTKITLTIGQIRKLMEEVDKEKLNQTIQQLKGIKKYANDAMKQLGSIQPTADQGVVTQIATDALKNISAIRTMVDKTRVSARDVAGIKPVQKNKTQVAQTTGGEQIVNSQPVKPAWLQKQESKILQSGRNKLLNIFVDGITSFSSTLFTIRSDIKIVDEAFNNDKFSQTAKTVMDDITDFMKHVDDIKDAFCEKFDFDPDVRELHESVDPVFKLEDELNNHFWPNVHSLQKILNRTNNDANDYIVSQSAFVSGWEKDNKCVGIARSWYDIWQSIRVEWVKVYQKITGELRSFDFKKMGEAYTELLEYARNLPKQDT